MTDEEELENYILDWHSDKKSHKFAKGIGMYLFQFIDQLSEQGLSEKTARKHADNCWAIGYLECGFGYRKVFVPEDVFGSSEASHEFEYGKYFSGSTYALNSYSSTWRKLHKYTVNLNKIKPHN